MNEPYKGQIRWKHCYADITALQVREASESMGISLVKAKEYLVDISTRMVLEQFDGQQWNEPDDVEEKITLISGRIK